MEAREEATVYRVKRIQFRNRVVPIICQNINGPCPLIALCNVLLLRGAISIHSDHAIVTFGHLCNIVTDYLVQANIVGDDNANVQYNVNDVLGFMPSLQHGLDVNVKFNSIVDFEFTQNQLVFDLLGVRLVHGWLVDPQDEAAAPVVGPASYNALVERIIQMRDIEERRQAPDYQETPEEKEANDKLIREGLVADDFLTHSAGQLTYHGLQRLHEDVQEGELCVLFRNNHFATLLRHQRELFVLVTDVGYANARVAWEKLCEIDGDNVFVGDNFLVPRLSPPPTPPPVMGDWAAQEEADKLLALRLFQEERMAVAAAAAAPPAAPPAPGQAVPPDLHGYRISETQMRKQQEILDEIQRQRQSPHHSPPAHPPHAGDRKDLPHPAARQPMQPLPQRLGYPQGQPQRAGQKNKPKDKCTVM